MAICGHQFHGGDESDWILSTSAGCLDGSTTANRILQELFKKHYGTIPNNSKRMKRQKIVTAVEDPPKPELQEEEEEEENQNLIVRKITGVLENFDESQHLNGCPVKWLYKKKLLDKNKIYKVGRLCYKTPVKEEIKKEKSKNLRDRMPIEVKIHKINLIEKYTSNYDDYGAPNKPYLCEKSGGNSEEMESHRKKLAAKLNWKLHDDSQEDYSLETSSEISSRHNYLPPRPLLGLKPLLAVLLAPHQGTNCCSVGTNLQESSTKEKARASLSIQSLDLPFFTPEAKPRPRTTNTPRWGAKSSRLTKKLQIPSQITINLGQTQNKATLKPDTSNRKLIYYNPPPGRKLSEKAKQTKTLSSLFYELKDKTNYRNQSLEYFEEMIRDLTMEEGQFKIKRFLNITSKHFNSPRVEKSIGEAKEKMESMSTCGHDLNLMCGKVRFAQKPLSSKKQNPQEKRRKSNHS